ncbi:MAG: LAGLIDADG family homing endonuclease [Parcubacteria group bacterium]
MGIKYAVNENFFKRWSHKMAYVLGYLYADGSLEDASYLRGKYVRVSSVDRENILRIKKWLSSEHNIIETEHPNSKRQKQYLLRIGSHVLYDDLTRLGLFPKKSLTIKFPDVPKKYLSSFILGYFDGDGCVLLRKGRNKDDEEIIKGLRVVFTCGSKEFLEALAKKTKNIINTKQEKVYNGCKSFMLAFSTEDSIKIFKFIYGKKGLEFLRRKYVKFCEYFILRPKRSDEEVKKIIKKHKVVWRSS